MLLRLPLLILPAVVLAQSAPSSLDAKIRPVVESAKGTVSLYARNLDTGAEYALRADDKVRTASTIKLPILAAAADLVQSGKLSWTETLELREEDKVSGSGVLSEFTAGQKFQVRDVANVMIVVSDNTGTNMILELITADAVNNYLDRIGLPQTRSMRKVRGDGSQLKAPSGWSKAGLLEENKKYGLGVSTPREMVKLLELLEQGKIASPEASNQILATLERQQYKHGIGRHMEGKVASKSGGLDRLRSDVGIVYTPKGRVAIAITVDDLPETDYSPDNAGELLISQLAQILVRGLTQ
jgi:beta-lactamase class A